MPPPVTKKARINGNDGCLSSFWWPNTDSSSSTRGEGYDNDSRGPLTMDPTPLAPRSSTNHDNLDDFDQFLANAMTNLSLQKREQVYNEIHGVSKDVVETQEFIESKLHELQIEINQIAEKGAFHMALTMAPSHVQDRTFRLMFLRSLAFDTKATAKRLVQHFEVKLRLFGPEKLGKTIELEDLDEDDLELLHSGCYHALPSTDRSGRTILCYLL